MPNQKKKEVKKKLKPSEKNARNIWFYLRIGIIVVQAIASVVFLVSLISMNILGMKWVVLIGLVLLALLAFCGIMLLSKKGTNKIVQEICIVISALCIAGSILAFQYTNAFNGFLSRVTGKITESKWYSVVVKNDSAIDDADKLAGKSVGLLKTDTTASLAEKCLSNQVEFKVDYYNDISTMLAALVSNLSDAMVFEAERYDVFSENAKDAVAGVKTAFTFKIEFEADVSETSTKEITTESFILYISGTDSRTGVDDATARSDVNILVVVNPATSKMLLVTIPRDMYLQLHGTTGLRDKLTHAGLYGIEMSKTTIEDFLSIKIDYTAKVSFQTVVGVVDRLDGIEIFSDTEMTLSADKEAYTYKKCHYSYGLQVVDGECALRFARERKMYYWGDLHRGENQQVVLTGIINKLTNSKEYLLKLPSILDAVADTFRTSLSRDEITAFIRMQLANQTHWQIESIGVGYGGDDLLPTYTLGADRPLYVMFADEDSVVATKARINEYLATTK